MSVLGKDLFDFQRSHTNTKVEFGASGYWVEMVPEMQPYGTVLTEILNLDVTPFQKLLDRLNTAVHEKNYDDAPRAYMDMQKGFGSLPLYRLYLMDFRYFGDMKIEEFVGEEAREAFAEYVINEEREIPSFMQQQIKDIQLIQERYGIAGHNYVKLRDIGKAVGFNVFWDADSGCVQIETGAPYTGEAPSAEAVPPAAAPSDVDAAKQDIVARTNALRAERGIAALTADDQLMRAAQVRADEMAATGTYSHTRPDGRKYYTVTDCRQVGENIHQIPLLYLAQQKSALAETLVYSWSKSAGHMENMTDESYAAIGVGLARGTDANGLECWYCVQLFLRSGYSISAVDKPATK